MQSSWGPRLFWLVVFILAGLGIYVLFSDPADDLGRVGFNAPQTNMVTIGPKLGGCQIQLGLHDQEATSWRGELKLAKGKILQFYAEQADPDSVFSTTRFECKSQVINGVRKPIILHLVYYADQDDTLSLTIAKETQKITLADVALEKQPIDLFAGAVRLQGKRPVQLYENDSSTDDHHPVLSIDSQGNDYLLYMNSERSKGIDVNSVLAGSFESLENPVIGTTLRLSRFKNDSWQYSEAVTSKLDSCLDPVAAMDNTGRMYVAWIQKGLEGWDIYYQFKDYGPKGDSGLNWSKTVKLTTKVGYYQQLVASTDSKGYVWLAWQTWHQDHCEIYAAVLNHNDKHFMKTPGPVADHPQDIDGRWFPALAPDRLGNMYLAWTVFRQGHFDIEVMKLYENMVKSQPVQVVSSNINAFRPSLACDKDNQLWVAYEESDTAKNFGDIYLPASKIRVRTLRTDGSIDEWPLLSIPKAEGTPSNEKEVHMVRCLQPRMVISPEGQPFVVFRTQQAQYYSRWQNSNWSEPILLSQQRSGDHNNVQALYQNGQIAVIQEVSDWKGRVRLQFAASPEQSSAVTITQKPAPLVKPAQNDWKPFAELARQFRKRTGDLILRKLYLLRGLVALPGTINELSTDPLAVACAAYEQSLYDWILLPHSPQASAIRQWQTDQQAHLLSQQSDRCILLGSYRPMVGQKEPMLIIDGKKDEMPLVPLSELESYRKSGDKANRLSVTQAADRNLMSQFLGQRQRLGFSLTDDWKLLPILTQRQGAEALSDNLDRMLLPLWHPEETPARKMPAAMRVVAYANGKSHDHLLDALRERHFYVATDDIYLLVRCEKHLPGDGFRTSFRPAISVTAFGTGKLKAVEVWLDNKLVKSETPPGQAAVLEYLYEQDDGQWHSYLVRVTQENGAEAVAQPFWIRYVP